jgi:hypothetical protein
MRIDETGRNNAAIAVDDIGVAVIAEQCILRPHSDDFFTVHCNGSLFENSCVGSFTAAPRVRRSRARHHL